MKRWCKGFFCKSLDINTESFKCEGRACKTKYCNSQKLSHYRYIDGRLASSVSSSSTGALIGDAVNWNQQIINISVMASHKLKICITRKHQWNIHVARKLLSQQVNHWYRAREVGVVHSYSCSNGSWKVFFWLLKMPSAPIWLAGCLFL